MPSAMNDVVNGILSGLGALTSSSLSGVIVEGSKVVSSRGYRDTVIVGNDGDPDSDIEPVFTQVWSNMAQTRRSETGDIPGAVIATTGSANTDLARERASVILDAVEAWFLADPTMANLVGSIEFLGGATRTIENDKGSAIVVPFSVRYWTTV